MEWQLIQDYNNKNLIVKKKVTQHKTPKVGTSYFDVYQTISSESSTTAMKDSLKLINFKF